MKIIIISDYPFNDDSLADPTYTPEKEQSIGQHSIQILEDQGCENNFSIFTKNMSLDLDIRPQNEEIVQTTSFLLKGIYFHR